MSKRLFWYFVAIAAFSAGNTNAQYSAWINMAGSSTSSGLTNVSCCDGNTQGANIGGLDCRKNVNTTNDRYMYFAVADSYAVNGNRPDLWITIHYYDNGTGALTLQYDASSSAYKTAGNVSLTNTNTWKAFGWHVTDAYFGNRQNGGADFRVNRSTTGNFYMDLVYVREFCSGAPCVSMVTPPGFSNGNQAFRDLFQQSGQWTTARSKIDEMGSFDHRVNVFSDSELASWLPQITGWGKRFSLETGVVKDWCHTGEHCFNAQRPMYDRFQNLGGSLDVFTMDEPLTAVRAFGLGSDQYAWEQTARWMQLVRQNYPNTRIISIEAYPYINQTSLQNWISNLNNRCAVIGIQGIDGFMMDADWRNFPGNGSWSGVKALENYCHNRGVPFINTYWASPHSTSTNNCDWNNDIMTEGTAYQNAGGTPAEYNIESWLVIPTVTVPDTGNCTFTRSVVDFCNAFVPGGGGGSSQVTIDMGNPDVVNGLTHINCCDGKTVPWPMGGRTCRANETEPDRYFYFNISDSFALNGNKPNLTFTIEYFDKDTGNLSLQYDSTSGAYKQGPSINFTNTNTWKTVTWSVNDAYCGNRQNGGADFRLAYFNGLDFYVDIVRVSNP